MLIASNLALAGCERNSGAPEPAPQAPPAAPAPKVVSPPPPVLPPSALGRAELLLALDAAASTYAAGRADDAQDLRGRRFAIRQAFGCSGAAPAAAGAADGHPQLTRNTRQKQLEISLRPADWSDAPIMEGGGWEEVEGFWLARPWLRTEGCPASRPVVAGVQAADPPAPQTAGLAAVFGEGDSRLSRQAGRAFRHTIRDDQPLEPASDGYRLVLEGRFSAFPDGRVIRCLAVNPEVRPMCVAAAEVDRIAFEDADGMLLSEWRRG